MKKKYRQSCEVCLPLGESLCTHRNISYILPMQLSVFIALMLYLNLICVTSYTQSILYGRYSCNFVEWQRLQACTFCTKNVCHNPPGNLFGITYSRFAYYNNIVGVYTNIATWRQQQ